MISRRWRGRTPRSNAEERVMLSLLPTLLLIGVPTEREYVLYAVMAVAVVLMTISIRRRQREGFGTKPKAPRPRLDELTAQRGVKDDMQQLLAELQDLSRKINAQIDTKFAKLEAAIADADRRIEVLQRLSRTEGGRPSLDVTVDGEAPAEVSAAPSGESNVARRHELVYDMADSGKTAVEIAQALGRTPGEVELILALRRKS
jgi:hypothetical protein